MESPTPQESWHDRFRKREDRRSFYIALVASGLFHLSMVTVFSIVIYFPREDTDYYDFKIVPLGATAVVASQDGAVAEAGLGAGPDIGSETLAGGDKLALRGGLESTLPALELPTLEFAELERLRVRQEGQQSLSRYDDIFKTPPADSWARFSRGLSGMSRSFSRLKLSGNDDGAGDAVLGEGGDAPERIVHRPADGFEAQIVWAAEPRGRKLLFAPPIEALWGVDGDAVQRPIDLVIQVNALGRVVNVFCPTVDERELVDAVQMTVLRYRFEPLDLDNGDNQTATLHIARETSRAEP